MKCSQIVLTASSLKEYTVSYGAASMLLEHLFLTTENQSENPWTQKVGIDLLNSFSDTVQYYGGIFLVFPVFELRIDHGPVYRLYLVATNVYKIRGRTFLLIAILSNEE